MGGVQSSCTQPQHKAMQFSHLWTVKEGAQIHIRRRHAWSVIVVYAAALVLLLTCVWIALYLSASGDFFHFQYLHMWTSTNGFQVYMPDILYEISITKPKGSRVNKLVSKYERSCTSDHKYLPQRFSSWKQRRLYTFLIYVNSTSSQKIMP
jgi:hypothetical protein